MKIYISGEENGRTSLWLCSLFSLAVVLVMLLNRATGTAFVARAMKHVGRDSCLTSSSMSCFHRGIIDDNREWHTWLYRYSTGEGS